MQCSTIFQTGRQSSTQNASNHCARGNRPFLGGPENSKRLTRERNIIATVNAGSDQSYFFSAAITSNINSAQPDNTSALPFVPKLQDNNAS